MSVMNSEGEFVYKYTSSEKLLDKFHELERQEIYFALPNELNDPFEGLINIVYNGEYPQWRYFFEQYIQGMVHRYITVYYGNLCYSYTLVENIQKEILNEAPFRHFFKEIRPEVLTVPLEVNNLLNVITPWIMNIVSKCVKIYFGDFDKKCEMGYGELNKYYLDFLREFPMCLILSPQNYIANVASCCSLHTLQNIINNVKYNKTNSQVVEQFYDYPNQFMRDFESQYINSCRIASFSGSCNSMSMWGHYADAHKGVCLRFNVISDESNMSKKTESIGTIKFYNNDGLDTLLYKVHYPENYVDFMGDAIKILSMLYYQKYLSDISKEEKDTEIKKMIEFLHNAYTRKTKDWSYENEYRIILPNNSYSTKLRYDFLALDSIIFGTNTPFEKQKQIVDIIEQKCKLNHRKEFKFYQVNFGRSMREQHWDIDPIYTISLN